MLYVEELFSVSFEGEEKIKENPVPYGKLCRTCVEKTRFVGVARIRRREPQNYRLEGVTVIILPGKDKVTEKKKEKVMVYTRTLTGRKYAKILKGGFLINIHPDIPSTLRNVALWMPSKCMIYNIEEIIEDMAGL